MKIRLIRGLEVWCNRFHWLTHSRPYGWAFWRITNSHCPLASAAFRLQERWDISDEEIW